MRNGFPEDKVARQWGLSERLDNDDLDFDSATVRTQLRELIVAAKARAPTLAPPLELRANLERLSELVGLSEVDCRILEFAALIQHDRVLDDCADTLGYTHSLKVADTLATVLALDRGCVQAALGMQGMLARSGLLSIDRSSIN